MNPFDASILHFINGFAHRSWTADYLTCWLTGDGFQKGGIVMLLFWWAWFLPSENSEANREILVCTAIAAPFALALSRFISFVVPFRVRPLHTPALHIRLAETLSSRTLINWNSFPSDHAALFFTFVGGLFFVSRRIGLIALSFVLLIVCLPRIYLGIHYPTDIIAGAALGTGVAYLACLPKSKSALARPVLNWMTAHPSYFYACLFFYTYQVANAFGWVRDVIVIVWHISNGIIAKM